MKEVMFNVISVPIQCGPGVTRGAPPDVVTHDKIEDHLQSMTNRGWEIINIVSAQPGYLTIVTRKEIDR